MLKRLVVGLVISLVFAGITVRISPAVQIPVGNKPETVESKPLRIAVGAMITPKAGYAYYKQLLNYIGEKLNRPVKFVDRRSYAAINEELKLQNIDVAFVCGGPYVDGHDKFGMELLAAPQVNGKTVYYSYIIVPDNSPAKSLKDLKGKTFAFTDPLSNTGKLVPTYMLFKMGETPDTFFGKHSFSFGHDKSIKAVAQRIVDGAAVDSLIYDYMAHNSPELTSRIRIIEKSPPYGIPPLVVRRGIEPELKEKLKTILLNIHKDPKGRTILKGMLIEKFVVIKDSAYDGIREMNRELAIKKGETLQHEPKD